VAIRHRQPFLIAKVPDELVHAKRLAVHVNTINKPNPTKALTPIIIAPRQRSAMTFQN
jgi:hypothetical protein